MSLNVTSDRLGKKQEAAADSDNPIVCGSLARAIWQMSWPLLAAYVLSSLIGLVDAYLAGFIGDAAQAAVGIGEQAIFLMAMLGTGLAIGTVACVSRSFGAGDLALARAYSRDSLVFSSLVGLFATVVGVLLARPVFAILGAAPVVTALGARYLELVSLANLPFVVAMCMTAIFRAVGAPRYALGMWLAMSSVSIGGSLLLFFGFIPGGRHSLDALCLSWLAGATVGVALGLVLLRRFWMRAPGAHRPALAFGQALVRVSELLGIGLPAVIAEVVWTSSNFLTYRIFAGMAHASQAQAAWSVALKVEETFAAMPLVALSMAAATIVGQNLGAGQPARARASGWQITAGASVAMILVGLVLMVFAIPLASTFSSDPLVVEYTATLLKSAPLTVPLLAVWLILFGAMEGAACTWTPMVCQVAVLIGLRLPLYWLLAISLQLGLPGIAGALLVSRAVIALVAVGVYRRGFVEAAPSAGACLQLLRRLAGVPRPACY